MLLSAPLKAANWALGPTFAITYEYPLNERISHAVRLRICSVGSPTSAAAATTAMSIIARFWRPSRCWKWRVGDLEGRSGL